MRQKMRATLPLAILLAWAGLAEASAGAPAAEMRQDELGCNDAIEGPGLYRGTFESGRQIRVIVERVNGCSLVGLLAWRQPQGGRSGAARLSGRISPDGTGTFRLPDGSALDATFEKETMRIDWIPSRAATPPRNASPFDRLRISGTLRRVEKPWTPDGETCPGMVREPGAFRGTYQDGIDVEIAATGIERCTLLGSHSWDGRRGGTLPFTATLAPDGSAAAAAGKDLLYLQASPTSDEIEVIWSDRNEQPRYAILTRKG